MLRPSAACATVRRTRPEEVALEEDGSGVHAQIELHRGDPGVGLAACNGPLDGGGAPILREKGGVNVDRAMRGAVEDVLAEDLSIGHDHQNVGPFRDHAVRLEPEFFRLENLESEGLGGRFDRRGPQGQTAALRAIRLRDHKRDFMVQAVDGLEGWHREIAGAHEDDLQRSCSSQSFALARFRSLRTIRSRLSGLRRSTKSFPSTWSIS